MGWAALLLLVAGVFLMARPNDDPYLGAVTLRAGLVLGALWLALPNIRRTPRWLLAGVGVLAVVIVVRPRLVLYAVPVAAAVAFLASVSKMKRS